MSANLSEAVGALFEFMEQRQELKSLPSCTQEMLDKALDRVIEGTDSKISLVPGYKRKLYQSILKSLEYADSIIEQIPNPVDVSCERFVDNPYLRAFFQTTEGLKKVCNKSSELREFFAESEHAQYAVCCALLCMRKVEETMLGMRLEGDHVIRDVMQTRVTFKSHRIQSPAVDESFARRELKCCMFEGLVDNALAKISALRARRRQLETEQRTLNSRLRSPATGTTSAEKSKQFVQEAMDLKDEAIRLKDIEQELEDMGYVTPEASLEQVNRVLSQPENFISMRSISITLDKMSIVAADDRHPLSANKLSFSEVTIKGQPPRIVTLARIKRDEVVFVKISFPVGWGL